MKKITLIILSLCFFLKSNAQNTFYYKLTKHQHKGILTTNVSGGQFITFLNDICYESDKKGIGLGHGTLQLNNNYSNSDFKIFIGNSYWGNSATFKFKFDMSMLNVVTDDGDIYVFKRDLPPAGVTKSSFIRKTNPPSNQDEDYDIQYNTPLNNHHSSLKDSNHFGEGHKNGRYNNCQKSTNQRTACRSCMYTNGKCSVCKGTGRQTSSVAGYSTKTQCRNCGGDGRCPTCGGDGWIN